MYIVIIYNQTRNVATHARIHLPHRPARSATLPLKELVMVLSKQPPFPRHRHNIPRSREPHHHKNNKIFLPMVPVLPIHESLLR